MKDGLALVKGQRTTLCLRSGNIASVFYCCQHGLPVRFRLVEGYWIQGSSVPGSLTWAGRDLFDRQERLRVGQGVAVGVWDSPQPAPLKEAVKGSEIYVYVIL